MNPLYVGIDVISKTNVVYLMKPDGSKHSNFPVANSLDGARQLSKRIVSAITSESLTDVIIGLEATSVYGDNLVCFLREDWNLTNITFISVSLKSLSSLIIPDRIEKFSFAAA